MRVIYRNNISRTARVYPPEYVGCRKEPLRNELRVEGVPVLARDERRVGVQRDLAALLQVGRRAEDRYAHVQRVAREVDEVPHVAQVRLDALEVDLLRLLPNES